MNHSSRHRFHTPTIRITAALATLLACLGPLPTVRACPMCAESLHDGPAEAQPDAAIVSQPGQDPGRDVARGYFWSILFMLCMPFLFAAGMLMMLVVTRRRPEVVRSP